MFVLEYTLNDMFQYKKLLAAKPGFSETGDAVLYPEEVASGISRFYMLNGYISIQIADYTANTTMLFKRMPSASNHICLNFQDFTFSRCIKHAGCDELVADNNKVGSVNCKSCTLGETVVIEKGRQIKLVLIFLKEGWADLMLVEEDIKDTIVSYLAKNETNYRFEYLTQQQKELLYEIINQADDIKLRKLYNESRILNLLQSFLCQILNRTEKKAAAINDLQISEADKEAIQEAEKLIIDNIYNSFPGVAFLSRKSCMSRTKFIILFQKIHNISAFDYFQKKRLGKAYELLLEGHLPITEIRNKIGYSSNHNFSLAFKKEFGLCPKELSKSLKHVTS